MVAQLRFSTADHFFSVQQFRFVFISGDETELANGTLPPTVSARNDKAEETTDESEEVKKGESQSCYVAGLEHFVTDGSVEEECEADITRSSQEHSCPHVPASRVRASAQVRTFLACSQVSARHG